MPFLKRNPSAARARWPTSCVMVILAVAVGGCTTHTWAPGPGINPASFSAAKAQCSLFARHSGGGFSASGSAKFVAGAALGYGIGDAVRQNDDFNDCMLAGGWQIADAGAVVTGGSGRVQLNPAGAQRVPVDSREGSLQAINAQRMDCIKKIRDEPNFATLHPHFSDLATSRFSMTQLADEHTPTEEDGRLLAAYFDELTPCATKQIEAMSELVPALGPILSQMRSENEATIMLLIKQQLTWGQAAQRQQRSLDAAIAKAGTVRA